MLSLDTVGSPRERGRAHGQQAAALVRAVSERYARKGALGADPAPVLRKLGAAFPELIEEMRGIAEGAGLSPDLVFRVNLQRLGAGPDRRGPGRCFPLVSSRPARCPSARSPSRLPS